MKNPTQSRSRRWLIIFVLLLVALPGGYYVARHHGWPAYKSWREAKLARMTEGFMAAGDYDNALLTARQALRDNQRSLAHWKLAAAAAKAKNSPEAIYYQQNVLRIDKTLASRLEFLRLTLQHGDYRDALDAIEGADEPARGSAEFHELAARTYLGLGRTVPAKLHLYSLVTLRPDDEAAQLDLAEIELAEDAAGNNPAVRQTIERLSAQENLRARALTLLLKDAIALDQPARAVTLADRLGQTKDLSGEQRVLVLAGLARGDAKRAEDYRRRLQTEFAKDPAAVVALATYYRQSGSPQEARRWFDSLPAETRENLAVQEAMAAAFLEWKEWARLDQAVAGTAWKDREFMRQAFTAYSARKTGRLADAGNAWRLAVIQAGDSARKISELLALVARWGWQSEQYDLVWKLFALMPRNESISRQLIAWERHQGRTANLNRIYARLAEFSSDDRMVRNNFAYTSMLLDANLSKAYEYARGNHRAEPENPFFATTQAFALYKQNKPAEALALLESLRPSALSVPERTMFRALFRAASGDAAGAADLLSGLKSAGFLPEERRLVTRTTEEIARLDRNKGDNLRLFAANDRGEIDHNKGWLRALPEQDRAKATVDMQAADSLLAMGDIRGLGAQLRKGAWDDFEHLRLALVAYVSRQRAEENSARSYWRTAMGTAAGSADKLKHLESLASLWNWSGERAEALSRIYEGNPANKEAFTELITYYRSAGRTSELVSVLQAYLSAHPRDAAQQCSYAYYSMLSGLNVAQAYITARDVYQAAPREADRSLVYAFSLWKQRRPQEAWEILEHVEGAGSELVPAPLLRAAVLADMERRDDAKQALQTFQRQGALPEEATIATLVASKLNQPARVTHVN
ncbi:MAG TPA: hypothetical protein VEQ65_01210 [Opitutus sp.]|nr:hypothetical protein [Opitutus sp.]